VPEKHGEGHAKDIPMPFSIGFLRMHNHIKWVRGKTMKANHRIYSLIILILTASLMPGCGLIKGYGKVRLSSEQGYDMTIQELQENWKDYIISYAGTSISNPAGIMFDPKDDGRELVGDRWTSVEGKETVSEIIGWIKTYTQFHPKLHVILGPDNQLFGYLFSPWGSGDVVAKVIDERTLYVYDLMSPVYIDDLFKEWLI
jgi:hypothetical protein